MSEAFKVGDEVIVWPPPYWEAAWTDRVRAVHKTGHFVLEGDPRLKFRQSGFATGGQYQGIPHHVVHATDEERAKCRRARVKHDVRAAMRNFHTARYTTERLEKLLELLEPDVDPHP